MVRILSHSASDIPGPPIAAAAGDPGKGGGVFTSRCRSCHSNARNGPVVLGAPL